MIHSEINVVGKRPHDEGIRKGVKFTTAHVLNTDTGETMLLVGIADAKGVETAIAMTQEEVLSIAIHLTEEAIKL